jgi:branched-chain amino acid transport system substrate-binding protein
VTEKKIPLIITNAGAADLTGKLKSPYIFRVSFANGQTDLAGGWYAYHKMGHKRMSVIAPDYSAGHEKADAFMKTFREAGGKIVDEIYPPLTTTDFGPYLTKIIDKAGENDAVWMFFSGSGAVRLIKQYQEYGLKEKIPLFVQGDTVDDIYFPSMKDSALGAMNYLHYAHTVDTPENRAFVKAYEAKYKEKPWALAYGGYLGAAVIVKALDAVKGDVENRDAFLAALRKVKFNAPAGLFAFDENQNVIINVFIRKVEKAGSGFENKVLETIPNVDQEWSPAKMKK